MERRSPPARNGAASLLIRKKHGGLYWELASISPVKDPDGTITHFVKVGENITERKRVEDALRITHHFLQIVNQHTEMASLLHEFVTQTQAITGCTVVGIRLLPEDGSDLSRPTPAPARPSRVRSAPQSGSAGTACGPAPAPQPRQEPACTLCRLRATFLAP